MRDLYAQQLNKYDNLLAQFNKREQEYNNSYQNLDFAEKQYKSKLNIEITNKDKSHKLYIDELLRIHETELL